MRRRIFIVLVALCILVAATCSTASARSHHRVISKPLVKVPDGWPKTFAIPRFKIKASVESLAFDRASDVNAPYKWGDVAWYDLSVKPGDQGHSIIFGHLDSACCPAVFYHVRDMKPGDIVQIGYKSGNPLRFRVMWRNIYANSQVPNKWIYGASTQRSLILMTCTGVFHTNGIGYDHRVVVYLRLILRNGKLG